MSSRDLVASLLVSFGFVACVPPGEVACPETTQSIAGECIVSCVADDECLVGEVCHPGLRACVRGVGERPAITELRALEASVPRGRPARIIYAVEGATSVEIDQGVLAETDAMIGEVVTPPLGRSTTFTLTAYGPGGRTTQAIVVDVSNIQVAPEVRRFTVNPQAIRAGELCTISWDVLGADTITLMRGEEIVHVSTDAIGSIAYFPIEQTTLTLSAANEAGATRVDLTIVVSVPEPKIEVFEATPSSLFAGGRVRLSWRTTAGKAIELHADGMGRIFRSEDPAIVAAGEQVVTLSPTPESPNEVHYQIVLAGEGERVDMQELIVHVQQTGN